ncbi:hypothetical protein, partial [Aeromicrobium sp.]|uniref:hypothetical protein n=1 Tax=Aeromicrobium sp. TaxID=1871063 RepID=UPI003C6B0EAA
MRGHIVIGSALTAAVLTMVAAVISGIVAADQISAKDGTIARGFLVVAALAITAFAWWITMQPVRPARGPAVRPHGRLVAQRVELDRSLLHRPPVLR